jgi:hypothetical protein
MSSSQGAPGQTGYTFTQNAIRDSSDWTSRIRQAIVYKEYSTPANVSRPPWMVRGNRFRMTYALGQFKCKSGPACQGDAIDNTVVPGTLV